MTNVKNIYDLESQFSNNKFMDSTIQFVHKTWGGVWVVIAISSYYYSKTFSRKFLQFSSESDRVFQTGQPGLDPRLVFHSNEAKTDRYQLISSWYVSVQVRK